MHLAPPIYLVRKEKGWLDPLYFTEAEAAAAAKAAGLDPGKTVFSHPGRLGRFPTPMHPGWLSEMIKRRYLVAKTDLKDAAWYVGECRNANLAQWDAKRGVFVHWRQKFEKLFPETIKHPEDDEGYDVYWPVEQVYPIFKADDLRGRDWNNQRSSAKEK